MYRGLVSYQHHLEVDSNAGEDLTRVLVDAVAEQAKKFERKGLTRGSFVLSVPGLLAQGHFGCFKGDIDKGSLKADVDMI